MSAHPINPPIVLVITSFISTILIVAGSTIPKCISRPCINSIKIEIVHDVNVAKKMFLKHLKPAVLPIITIGANSNALPAILIKCARSYKIVSKYDTSKLYSIGCDSIGGIRTGSKVKQITIRK